MQKVNADFYTYQDLYSRGVDYVKNAIAYNLENGLDVDPDRITTDVLSNSEYRIDRHNIEIIFNSEEFWYADLSDVDSGAFQTLDTLCTALITNQFYYDMASYTHNACEQIDFEAWTPFNIETWHEFAATLDGVCA